jgi:PAS domain S-box-containing protein
MYIPIRSALQADDVARLISSCENARDRLVVLALVEAGLRPRELSEVQLGDIEWDQRVLRVAGREDVVPVSEALLEVLRVIFERRRTLRLGNRQIQRIVRAVGERAGHEKPVTPDVLRRTWQQHAAAAAAARNGGRILESAAEAAPDVILVADDERRFVDVNRAAEDLLALPRQQIIGRRIDEFFSEAQGKPVAVAWDDFVSEGEQRGLCELAHGERRRVFEYRARAQFGTGLHVSVLREVP